MESIVDLTEDMAFHMEAPGQPRPMVRPRKYRNIWVSPSKTKIGSFREEAKRARSGDEIVFEDGVLVEVEIQFYMKRPVCHFKGRDRTKSLKSVVSSGWSSCGGDIDNLCKFVLDALQGVVYKNDRQVVRLVVSKRKDDKGSCEGRTVVNVKEC